MKPSFYVVKNTNKFRFSSIEELQTFADEQAQVIESFDIRLDDHCPDLSDEDYERLSKLDTITIEDIWLIKEEDDEK